MGTYRIQASSVLNQPPGIILVGASTLLQIINTFPSTGGIQWQTANSGSISVAPDSSGIFLDGSGSPIGINSLPVGFNLVNASVVSHNSKTGDSSSSWHLVIGAATSPLPDVNSFAYTPPLNLDSVLATLFGANLTTTVTSALVGDLFSIQGSYQIISSQWVVNNLTSPYLPAGKYLAGDILQITSSPPGAYNFSNITNVLFGGLSLTLIFQSSTQVQPQMPTVPPNNNPSILSMTSTQFSGSAFVAAFGPIIANGTGVYQLTPGQTHDTMYSNSATGNTTVNVARPNVFGKTGFIGG